LYALGAQAQRPIAWQRPAALLFAPRSFRSASQLNAKKRPFRGPFRFLGRSGKKEAENNRPFRRGELCAFLSTSSMPTGNVNPATDRGTRWRGSEPRLGRQGGASRAGIPPNNVHRGPAFRFNRFVSVSSFQLCFADVLSGRTRARDRCVAGQRKRDGSTIGSRVGLMVEIRVRLKVLTNRYEPQPAIHCRAEWEVPAR
jgi:hypothetical protein